MIVHRNRVTAAPGAHIIWVELTQMEAQAVIDLARHHDNNGPEVFDVADRLATELAVLVA